MRFLKYFIALWSAALFYLFASFFVGGVGISAYKQLEGEHAAQLQNLAALQAINTNLAGEKDALENDPDTIAVHARELGYGVGEERFIRIVGRMETPKPQIDPGAVYIAKTPDSVTNKTLLIISIVIFVFMMMSIIVLDILQYIKNA
jgi:cell division protein FtsB